MTAARLEDDGAVVAADALQAAYFRGTLAEQREGLAHQAATHRTEMGRLLEVGAMAGIPYLRSQVRSLEAQLHHLDGLIAGLERRFAPTWAASDQPPSWVS